MGYNLYSFIGQFVTILSVNKTRTLGGRFAPTFLMDAFASIFLLYKLVFIELSVIANQ